VPALPEIPDLGAVYGPSASLWEMLGAQYSVTMIAPVSPGYTSASPVPAISIDPTFLANNPDFSLEYSL